MPESEYSQDNLAAIRTHLTNLEQMVRFNTATNPNNKTAIEELFSSRSGLAQLYLALDGEPKTQQALAATLGVNQSTISRTMKVLIDAGLITLVPFAANGQHTAYTRSGVEALLGVSKLARAMLAKEVKERSLRPPAMKSNRHGERPPSGAEASSNSAVGEQGS